MKDASRINEAPTVSISHVKTNIQEYRAFQIHNIMQARTHKNVIQIKSDMSSEAPV